MSELAKTLAAADWQSPPMVDALSWLVWLNPNTPLAQMPVLPQVHDGRYHELLLTREVEGRMLALRLWRSRYRIGEGAQSLWLGNISELKAVTRGGLSVPRTQLNFDQALALFGRQLDSLPVIHRHATTLPTLLRLSLSATE